jgi:hypothetical protein
MSASADALNVNAWRLLLPGDVGPPLNVVERVCPFEKVS